MKKIDVVISLIAALALTLAANHFSEPKSRLYVSTNNGYTLSARSIPTAPEENLVTLSVTVTGQADTTLEPLLRFSKLHQDETTLLRRYGTVPLAKSDTSEDLYSISLRTYSKGKKNLYYFEIRDPAGRLVADLMKSDDRPFAILPVATVPGYVVWGHSLTMFAAAFAITLGLLASVRLLRGGSSPVVLKRAFFVGALFVLMSGGVFGTLVKTYQFGGGWQGIPIGSRLSDNSLVLLLVMLAFVSLGTVRIKTKSGERRLVLQKRFLGWLGIITFAMMPIVFLLPSDCDIDGDIIAKSTYALIVIALAAYLLALTKARDS